ncbi:hypothetical protein WJX72_002473 [[Myrmecia] bisecta]|uniref:Lipoprotein n=1 Tax=[Myrmecia] bisecta TaxID=41462 RepID=A0AAW1R516_9CHLO
MAKHLVLAGLLVLLGLSGCLAGDNASRKLLQAIPAMCTGTVSNAAKCPTFQNNHDGCNATPGCQAGKFVDDSSPLTQFTIVDANNGLVALQADSGLFLARCHTCSDAANQPETATIGISSAALPSSPFAHWKVVDAGNGKVAFQADSGNFLARCHNCYSQELLADSVTVHVPALAGNPWATWTPVAL